MTDDALQFNPGFAQFVQRHGAVAATPEIRKAYRRWEYEVILDRLDEERRVAEVEVRLAESEAKGKAEGKAEGEAKGKVAAQMEIALKAFAGMKRGKSQTDVIDTLKEFEIPDEIIETAKKQTEANMATATE